MSVSEKYPFEGVPSWQIVVKYVSSELMSLVREQVDERLGRRVSQVEGEGKQGGRAKNDSAKAVKLGSAGQV